MTTAEVALLVSIVSALLAATSTIWQIAAFKKSGYKVESLLEMGYIAVEQLSGGPMTTRVQASPKRWAETAILRTTGDQHFGLI